MNGQSSLKLRSRLAFFTAVLALTWPAAAPAATIDVKVHSTPALVEAFAAADANPDADYRIQLGQGTYKLSTTLTLTRGSVTLLGSPSSPAKYVLDGKKERRVFLVDGQSGGNPYLAIDGVTIQNGRVGVAQPGAGLWVYNGRAAVYHSIIRGNSANQPGAGIRASGNSALDLYWVWFDQNVNDQLASCGGGVTASGGGLAVTGTSGAVIYSATFTGNKACRGGAIVLQGSASMWLENSTISGNEAVFRGGGIFLQGGAGEHWLRFNTIAFNRAGTTAGPGEARYGGGLGLWGFTGKLHMFGNILADNTVVNDDKTSLKYRGHDCFWDTGAYTAVVSGNIIGELDNCSQLRSSDGKGIGSEGNPFDPQLGPLARNGAADGFQLLTHKPLKGSPAIGFYHSPASPDEADHCSWSDQRAFLRPNEWVCDAGAIEVAGKPYRP